MAAFHKAYSCSNLLSLLRTDATRLVRPIPPFLLPQTFTRSYAVNRKNDSKARKKKKKGPKMYHQWDDSTLQQFSLCDAIRYIQAFEVGQPLKGVKYELHVKLRSVKDGPTIRSYTRLPHPVKGELRICVICPPDSEHAAAARQGGAVIVGEDAVLADIKEGKIEFDRCICHADSLEKLNKSGVGRVLGPRGLMPSVKTDTIVKDIEATLKDMVGSLPYRERDGVVRMPVGQLGFTPEELSTNIRSFMATLKTDMGRLSDRITKEVHEVVLSSSHGPGLSLDGTFKSDASPPTSHLSVG